MMLKELRKNSLSSANQCSTQIQDRVDRQNRDPCVKLSNEAGACFRGRKPLGALQLFPGQGISLSKGFVIAQLIYNAKRYKCLWGDLQTYQGTWQT